MREVVRALNGTVAIESEPGVGTKVRLTLPAAVVSACARVLVVEDEPTIRRAVGYALRRDGFDVEEVGDGRDALEADAGAFDVVLLDLGPAQGLGHRGAAPAAGGRAGADHRPDRARDASSTGSSGSSSARTTT